MISDNSVSFRYYDEEIPVHRIESVYLRRWPILRTRPADQSLSFSDLLVFSQTNSFHENLLELMELEENIYWVSPPGAILQSENKVVVLELAKQVGLSVPRTLVTSKPSEARRFMDEVDEVSPAKVCYKLTTSIVPWPLYETWPDSYEGIYTNLVLDEHTANLHLLEESPALFQAYVEKEYELRIYYIAGRFLTCKITSQDSERTKVDWRRYDIKKVRHHRQSRWLDEWGRLKGGRPVNYIGAC